MTNIKNSQLSKVSGGTDREHTVCVDVDFSSDIKFTKDITVMPYLDGELLTSQIRTLDCSVTHCIINLKGRGMASLKVKLNSDYIKEYYINFDEGSYKELA